MVGRPHPNIAQQSRRGIDKNDTDKVCSQFKLHSIPETFCDEIAVVVDHHIINDASATGAALSPPAEEV